MGQGALAASTAVDTSISPVMASCEYLAACVPQRHDLSTTPPMAEGGLGMFACSNAHRAIRNTGSLRVADDVFGG